MQTRSHAARGSGPCGHAAGPAAPVPDEPERADGFRFGRIMPRGRFQPMTLKASTARAVGALMTTEQSNVAMPDDAAIPAGYTYFGQFVDHDVTRDGLAAASEGDDPATDAIEATDDAVFETAQDRSPSLDLDSLYGDPHGRDRALFDGALFRIGRTTPTPGAGGGHSGLALPNDLPRTGASTPLGGPEADIADPRNDENLIVAQMHLVWLKVHNRMVRSVAAAAPDLDPEELFARARSLTVRHYQWLVLNDFVKRLVPEDVFEQVIVRKERRLLSTAPGEAAFMPVEFSVAAYRMGHSMVRNAYEWNLNFGSTGPIGTGSFRELFRFSGLSGDMAGLPSLPSNWIADFRQLFDLGGYAPDHLDKASSVAAPTRARRLDPFLAAELSNLPELGGADLAFRNLRRGSLRGLPSAQDFASFAGIAPATPDALAAPVIAAGAEALHRELTDAGFYARTPLWLYVLLEAAAAEGGERLGRLGGAIVAETFLTLALTSRVSILRGAGWHPEHAEDVTRPGTDRPLTDLANLLIWLDGFEPVINPLEDLRNGPL